jgi:FMN phosphatase YigB (HAD superfamily)
MIDMKPLRLMILDLDMTIAIPRDKSFYAQYGRKSEHAIAEYFDVSDREAVEIANIYRQSHGGAEHALFRGHHKPVNYDILHRHLSSIDTTGAFNNQSHIRDDLQFIRNNGMKVIILTSSPDSIAQRILQESGLMTHDFDALYAYTADKGPTKITKGAQAFADVMHDFGLAAHETLAVGDTIKHDIDPPLSLGTQACLISPKPIAGYNTAPTIETVLKLITKQMRRKP